MMYLVYNGNLPGGKEYAEQQFGKLVGGEFNFKQIQIVKDEYVADYEKLFFHDNGSFHPVKKLENSRYFNSYAEHIKNHKHHYVDKESKTMLVSEKPLEELVALL